MIIFLLTAYLNRGLFVAMPETEHTSMQTTYNHEETNSLLEFIVKSVFHTENSTDEDGNHPEAYGLVKFIQPFIFQTLFQSLELQKILFSSEKELCIPLSETIPALFICEQIDHPPQA